MLFATIYPLKTFGCIFIIFTVTVYQEHHSIKMSNTQKPVNGVLVPTTCTRDSSAISKVDEWLHGLTLGSVADTPPISPCDGGNLPQNLKSDSDDENNTFTTNTKHSKIPLVVTETTDIDTISCSSLKKLFQNDPIKDIPLEELISLYFPDSSIQDKSSDFSGVPHTTTEIQTSVPSPTDYYTEWQWEDSLQLVAEDESSIKLNRDSEKFTPSLIEQRFETKNETIVLISSSDDESFNLTNDDKMSTSSSSRKRSLTPDDDDSDVIFVNELLPNPLSQGRIKKLYSASKHEVIELSSDSSWTSDGNNTCGNYYGTCNCKNN